jgi:hypothetical protein
MQSNSVAVRLYRGNECDVSGDCAILYDKNCKHDSSDVLKYLTLVDDTALTAVGSRLIS